MQSFWQHEPPLESQWPLADLAEELAAARGDSAERLEAPNTAEARARITDNRRVFMSGMRLRVEVWVYATGPEPRRLLGSILMQETDRTTILPARIPTVLGMPFGLSGDDLIADGITARFHLGQNADSPEPHRSPTLQESWKGGGSLAAAVAGGKSELHRARGRVTPVRPEIHAGGHDERRGRQTVPQKTNRPGRKARARVKRRFKRPPPATQGAGHGKPPREQDQIGNL